MLSTLNGVGTEGAPHARAEDGAAGTAPEPDARASALAHLVFERPDLSRAERSEHPGGGERMTLLVRATIASADRIVDLGEQRVAVVEAAS